jgi:aldehyde dehydrogenase (NAD+)
MQIVDFDIRDRVQYFIQQQRQFFQSGKTQDTDFRLTQLKALKQAILAQESAIYDALKADLHKPPLEAYALEITVVQEIDYAIQHLSTWVRPKRVPTPWVQWPATSRIYPQPLGVVLIISPWNYPFQLSVAPLIGAIAAGNCALLKPSELAPHSSRVIANLIRDTFDPAYITVVEGGVEVSQALLEEPLDHIFFTGGTAIGKLVMAAAAQHLTPVTLELGGKSPCIVDTDIHLQHTARRIAWGKFINAGQSCIAPDYLLVDRQIKPALIAALKTTLQEFYGDDPSQSEDYARIVSFKQFERLTRLLQDGQVVIGGQVNESDRYIAPTLLDNVSPEAAIMQEEIFGPILPILTYEIIEEAIAFVNARPKPLALYLFSQNQRLQAKVLQATNSGGACINDTFMHAATSDLPFGGVGASGIGQYHGKATFDTFSHYKSVLHKSFWLDFDWRYAPYRGKLATLKRLLGTASKR